MFEDSDFENPFCIPADIKAAASAAIQDLLPSKSKDRYERTYSAFEDWCSFKKVKVVTEEVLLAYFAEKTKNYKSSTVWSIYSMLRSTLLLKKNIDIKTFPKLIGYLKRKSVGYQAKKSKTFSRADIDKFLIEAPDKEYLMMKVVVVFGLAGATRCEELMKMSIDDIEDRGDILLVNIPYSKTPTPRRFVVVGGEDKLNIALYRKYFALRPPQITHRRFFVNYKQGKCTIQSVGVHTFGKIPSKIAAYLGLENSKDYTGHCLRRSSATLFVDAGGDLTNLKRHGGWQSTSVAEGYIADSVENKYQIANRIQGQKTNYADFASGSEFPVNFAEKAISAGSSKNVNTDAVFASGSESQVNFAEKAISAGSCKNVNTITASKLLPNISISNVNNSSIHINITH